MDYKLVSGGKVTKMALNGPKWPKTAKFPTKMAIFGLLHILAIFYRTVHQKSPQLSGAYGLQIGNRWQSHKNGPKWPKKAKNGKIRN